MTRAEIIAVFHDIADIMQIRGDNPRRFQTYRRIARALDTIQEDIIALYEQDRLTEIPGIGSSTVEKIGELIETGRCEFYEELKASVPSGVLELMSVSGVGPSTAARLYQELDIDSLQALQEALDNQKLRTLKGMGKKTEENIKSGLEALIRHKQYKLMGHLLPSVESVVDSLAKIKGVEEVSITGDLRRRTETVRSIHIIASCEDHKILQNAMEDMESIKLVNDDWSDSGGSVKTIDDTDIRIETVPQDRFGAALLISTGSESHINKLNELAEKLGFSPTEWIEKNKGLSEDSIYKSLGLPFIVPELREDRGEIEAALSGKLPKLVELNDIRGDLHVHSVWSDGTETIESMAEAACQMGYEYIGVCDHSISSRIANGLDVERILNKMIEIRELNQRITGIEILMGSEVDILNDGSLDYPEEILEKLDVVIASVHSGFNMSETAMTHRIIRAIQNRFVHIIGHPTGRLLGRRDPYQINMDAVIEAAAENRKILEINAYPDRLDLKDVHARSAKEHGVMMSINTDAHNAHDLHLMIYGIHTARRGWLEREDVLNTLPLPELMKRLEHED
jgi:DNA polymerase (family 10)